MQCHIVAPKEISAYKEFLSLLDDPKSLCGEVHAHIHVHQTRAMYREIIPCLFRGPAAHARRMILCLLEWLIPLSLSKEKSDRTASRNNPVLEQLELLAQKNQSLFETRKLKLRNILYKQRKACREEHFVPTLLVSIVPNSVESRFEFGWEERLIHWEHQLILAQSLAGFYSTLGGGYFMTRKVGTALHLAVCQQRMALFMGDKEMYYKCQINQAYDLIRCGKFRAAKILIQDVQRSAALIKDQVLVRMCRSALLFRKRVRKSAMQEDDNPQGGSPPVDDFYRIRIIKDQSTNEDLQRSFHNTV